MTEWTTVEAGFCESNGSGPPEVLNAVSSIPIVLMGLHGMYHTPYQNWLIRIMFASMATTGIGSAGYHWTLHAGWGRLDRDPMIFLSTALWFSITNELLYHSCVVLPENAKEQLYNILSGTASFLFMVYTFGCIAVSSFVRDRTFSLLFAAPLIGLLVGIVYSHCHVHKKMLADENPSAESNRRAFEVAWAGAGCSIVASIIWAIESVACDHLDGVPIHALFHILMAYGTYLATMFLVYLHADNIGYVASFNNEKGIYSVFPVIVYQQTEEENRLIELDVE